MVDVILATGRKARTPPDIAKGKGGEEKREGEGDPTRIVCAK